jgi:N,N'-diacetyllegionaminate synthase
MGFKEKFLKADSAPYFIAEIGINHNGVFELAQRMIDASKDSGADAVKFQKRNLEALVMPGVEIETPTGYLSIDENDMPTEEKAFGTWTYPDKRLELEDEQILDLWKYSESKGLDFIVSPWEERSVDFLAENQAKVIKLASIDAANYQFCEYIAAKKIPVIVSTGMSNWQQLKTTYKIFKEADCPMMFLHCTSAYPCPIDDKHLNCLPIMRDIFEIDVGFSGHGVGFEGTLGAIALGARVVEKHVTLSRKMSGPDQSASLEFGEFNKLIQQSGNMVRAMGNARKDFLPSEEVLHGVLVKKIVTTKPIKKGDTIQSNMIQTIVTKQKGGLLPDKYYYVLGAPAVKDLPKNHILEIGDLGIGS